MVEPRDTRSADAPSAGRDESACINTPRVTLSSKTLVQQLRDIAKDLDGRGYFWEKNPVSEAADEIERLTREIKHWHASNANMLTYNRQYRAALELIANQQYHGVWDAGAVELQDIAKKALVIPAVETTKAPPGVYDVLRLQAHSSGTCPVCGAFGLTDKR